MSQRGLESSGGGMFQDLGQDGLMHRAFLRGEGFTASDVRRSPVIGIAQSSSDLNPCNAGLARLEREVKRGVHEAGGLALTFPTISISEPFTRPTSLYLRNLMSIDVEEMIATAPIDGVILLGGCDKTVPAQLMGAVSAGKPALMLTAGPRPVSCHMGRRPFTVDDAWPICDARRVGEIGDEQWLELEADLNVDVGTCNVMGTAASMAVVAEALGFALPGSAFAESISVKRFDIARRTGSRMVELLRDPGDPGPRITSAALENAFRVVTALGGSTNTVIHLEAIAGRAGLRIGPDSFSEWSSSTPYIADVRPNGTHTLPELDAAGGVPAVVSELRTLLDLDQVTATGRTWGEELDASRAGGTSVIRTLESPLAAHGGLTVIRGNLAPGGAILKIAGASGSHGPKHTGPVVVFDGIDDLNARIDDPDLEVDAGSILVLRGLGPVGAPGMPEVGHIPIPKKLHEQGVTDMVRISDARMSGTSTGTVVLHIVPEAAVGGPLARLQDGDLVTIDFIAGRLDHHVAPRLFSERRPPTRRSSSTRGFRKLHIEHVLQADEGCDFDFLMHPSTPRLHSTTEHITESKDASS